MGINHAVRCEPPSDLRPAFLPRKTDECQAATKQTFCLCLLLGFRFNKIRVYLLSTASSSSASTCRNRTLVCQHVQHLHVLISIWFEEVGTPQLIPSLCCEAFPIPESLVHYNQVTRDEHDPRNHWNRHAGYMNSLTLCVEMEMNTVNNAG